MCVVRNSNLFGVYLNSSVNQYSVQ